MEQLPGLLRPLTRRLTPRDGRGTTEKTSYTFEHFRQIYILTKSVARIQELPVNPAAGGWRYDGGVDMDKVLNWLFAAMTLLLSVRGEVFKGKDDHLQFVWTEWMHAGSPTAVQKVSWTTVLPDSKLGSADVRGATLNVRGNEALATCRRPLKQENVAHVCPRSRCFLRCRRAQPAGAPSDGINCLCRHKCEFTRPQVKAVHCLCLTLPW